MALIASTARGAGFLVQSPALNGFARRITELRQPSIPMLQHRGNLVEIRVLSIKNHDAIERPISAMMGNEFQKIAFGWRTSRERTIDHKVKYAGSLVESALNICIRVRRHDRIAGPQTFRHDLSPLRTLMDGDCSRAFQKNSNAKFSGGLRASAACPARKSRLTRPIAGQACL